jgi:peptide/nickel transport system permease protein
MKGFGTYLRRSPSLLAGSIMLSLLAAVAVMAPLIAPFDPLAIHRGPPSPSTPSSGHLLGTNDAGSDTFSRLVWGSRTSLVVAASATALLMVVALAVGLTAGLRGGIVDVVLMRITDVFLAVPVIPLIIFISVLAPASLTTSIVLIGAFTWPEVARVLRSQTLSLRARGFVRSARGFGAGSLYVMRRHLVPSLGPVIVVSVVQMASVVIAVEAGLAFLGLGDPSAVGWGQELDRALSHPSILFGSLWASWLLPTSLALAFTLFGLLLVGVGLEPWFNPRLRRAR